ncbi:hypothetical protein ACFWVC_01635 [Streptomyces sp. NPDC058691]|uniref:hypothetical protein n=1 Tax=Streptomyces sp. NPDC058691 TaxID=3346601 RepID=UPI00365722D9
MTRTLATALRAHTVTALVALTLPAGLLLTHTGLTPALAAAATTAERAWLHRPHPGKGVASDTPSAGGSAKTSDDRPHRK